MIKLTISENYCPVWIDPREVAAVEQRPRSLVDPPEGPPTIIRFKGSGKGIIVCENADEVMELLKESQHEALPPG